MTAWVYRAYDADRELLYIGCTSRLEARLAEQRSAIWRHDVVVIAVEEFASLEEALSAECQAINAEVPWWNEIHNFGDLAWTRRRTAVEHFDAKRSRAWSTDKGPVVPTVAPADLDAWFARYGARVLIPVAALDEWLAAHEAAS